MKCPAVEQVHARPGFRTLSDVDTLKNRRGDRNRREEVDGYELMLSRMKIRAIVCIASGALAMLSRSASAAPSQAAPAEPEIKRIVSMEYPNLARMAHLQTTVTLTATISPDGTVGGIRAEPGPEPLVTPAKENLSRWRFTGCASSSSECTRRIVYTFVLNGTCTDSPRCPTEFQVDLPDRVQVSSQVFGKVLVSVRKP